MKMTKGGNLTAGDDPETHRQLCRCIRLGDCNWTRRKCGTTLLLMNGRVADRLEVQTLNLQNFLTPCKDPSTYANYPA
eukprot:2461643-Amphidinium_carterae.1